MKKVKILGKALMITALVATIGTTMVACNNDDSNPDPDIEEKVTLSSIKVTKDPSKTTYYIGEEFSTRGMIVTANYSDGSKKAVTDYTYDKTGPLQKTDTLVTISYQGKTATVTIKVIDLFLATIEGNEQDVYRIEAENMNFDGCLEGASGTNSFIERPDDGGKTSGGTCAASLATIGNYFFAAVNNLKGPSKVDVRIAWGYGSDETLELDEWIGLSWNNETLNTNYSLVGSGRGNYYAWQEQTIRGLDLVDGENKLGFEVLEHIDDDGESVVQCPNIDYIEIDLTPSVVERIEVTHTPNKVLYTEGETFNPDGLIVSKVYDDGNIEVLDESEYKITPEGVLTTEDTEVMISFGDFTITTPITVLSTNDILESISIKTQPTKVDYFYGEKFDATGLEIEATYTRGTPDSITKRIIPIEELEIDFEHKFVEGDNKVFITYQGKSATIDITVSAPISQTIQKHGEFIIEAETTLNDNISTLVAEGSGSIKIEKTAVHGLGAGTELVSYIEVMEDTEVEVFTKTGRYEALNLKDCTELYIGDTMLESPDFVLGKAEDGSNDWNNYKEASYGKILLTKGIHKVNYKLTEGGDDSNRCPNVDYIKFVASPDDALNSIEINTNPTKIAYSEYEKFDATGLVVNGVYASGDKQAINNSSLSFDKEILHYGDDAVNVTYNNLTATIPVTVAYRTLNDIEAQRFECEYLSFDKTIGDRNEFGETEGTSFASNGLVACHLSAGSEFSLVFNLEEEMDVSFKVALARYEALNVNKCTEMYIDDIKLDSPDLVLGQTEGNQFHNYKVADYGHKVLAVGTHVIKFILIPGADDSNRVPNIDYFEISKYVNE